MSEQPITPFVSIGKIAGALGAARGGRERKSGEWGILTPGDVAALRRMDLDVPAPAFWKLMAKFVPEDQRQGMMERRWALLVKGMAVMAPNHHAPKENAGRILASNGFSRDPGIRIARLLKAEAEVFEDLFLSACRFLSSKAAPVDWAKDFGPLALYQNAQARNSLASGFYGAKAA